MGNTFGSGNDPDHINKRENDTMKIIALTAAALVALSTSAFGDTPDRPATWKFHEQYRNCDPDKWTQGNGNFWSNNTCESLANTPSGGDDGWRTDEVRSIGQAALEAIGLR